MVKKLILLCLGLFLFLLYFHRGIETEDVWLHLSTGQWIANHAQVPNVDPFPFAAERTPYLCHEWLASSALYLIFKTEGFTGLKIFRALFFVLSIGIFFGFAYRRLPFSLLTFLTLLLAYALYQRCLLRPDAFNLLFIQLFLIVLFSYEKKNEDRKLLLLPLIGIFWINLHMMGAFIYGGLILFIFILSAFLRRQYDQFRKLSLLGMVFLGIFIFNPYGLDGLLFPYKVLLFPKYYGFYQMIGITGELQAPAYIFFSFNYFYYILLIAFPILLFYLNKKADLTLNFLFIAAFLAFFYMSRNSSFFALIAVYTIVLGAQNIGFWEKWAQWRWSKLLELTILTWIVFFIFIQSFDMINETLYFNGKKYKALYEDTNPYVMSTIDLLKENKIQGPIFNCTLLGGVFLWNDYPSLRPFDDGRHLDYQRFHDTIRVLLDPQRNWQSLVDAYGLKVVVLTEGYDLEKRVISYLQTRQDWQLIAVKGPFVTFVKKGEFPLPKKLDHFEQDLKSDILTDKDKIELIMLLQAKQRGGVDRFFNPSPLKVDLFSDGVTLMNLGYNGAAARDFIEALKISDQTYMQSIVSAFLVQLK